MNVLLSEATPLLKSVKRIPWFQLSILLFLQVVEPLTSHVIDPFAPEPIQDTLIPFDNKGGIGDYVGLLKSIFYFAEAMTVLHWSRVSDQVGRKPVILIGIFGSTLSMLCLGLSRSFWGLLLSRCLGGFLNGNIGVIRSMMAEMVDTSDLARIYAFTPLAWSAGATIGPLIGEYLSPPAERVPDTFRALDFLKSYPYLLTSFGPMTLSVLSFVVTYLFLKETVKSPVPLSTVFRSSDSQDVLVLRGALANQLHYDPNLLQPSRSATESLANASVEPHSTLYLGKEPSALAPSQVLHNQASITRLLSALPNESAKLLSSSLIPKIPDSEALRGAAVSVVVSRLPVDPTQLLSLRTLLTRRVIVVMGNFALMSFVDITFREIQPLFLATPLALGGLGMAPSMIMDVLSVYNILNGCVQLLFFAQIHDYLGSKGTFLVGMALSVPLFLVFPITSLLAQTQGFGVLTWMAVALQTILPIGFSLSSGAIFMYITAAAPSRETTGITNGISQMLLNQMKGIGPGFATGLFSLSIESQYLGGYLVYYTLASIALLSIVAAWFLPRKLWNK